MKKAVENVAKSVRTNVGTWTEPNAKKGLNNNLVMYIAVGNYKNTGVEGADYNDTQNVRCLVEDMEFVVESQYSTPFQESDPQSKLPALHAALSSGTLLDMGNVLLGGGEDVQVEQDPSLTQKALNTVQGLMHKTSFSKVNSIQVYGSSASIRMTGTILLVAWDKAADVERALQLLQAWASPTKLTDQTAVVNVTQGVQEGYAQGEGFFGSVSGIAEGALNGLYQSVVPPIVAIRYGGKTYSDFYIESVSAPLSAPMNAKGERIAVKVQITFLSRKAWDRGDIDRLYGKS